MQFLKNLSIRAKLFLISVIPSLGLIYLLVNTISDSLDKRETALQVYQDCERVQALSVLIHELQNERGYNLSYVASNQKQDLAKISEQIGVTNKAVSNFREVCRSQGVQLDVLQVLDSLDHFRQETDTYTEKLNSVKSALLNELYEITQISRNSDIRTRLEAHLLLLYTKEYFSRTKNILLPFFINEGFQGIEFGRFAERKGQYELSRHQFLASAPEDVLDFYENAFHTTVIGDVHTKLDSLFIDPGTVRKMEASEWWNSTAAVVNALAETERHSLSAIRERAEAEMKSMDRNVVVSSIVGILVLLAVVFLVAYSIRQIVSAISEIKAAAKKLAAGEVDFSVNLNTQDEIGDLARSFNDMVGSIKGYAETAENIGKGDYEAPVRVRSDSDLLGKALQNMKDDLQRLSKETEVQTWLLTGNNLLNDRMRGEKELPVLANEVITQLSEFLQAQVGALYIRDNGLLKLAGRYAYSSDGKNEAFALGEGLVGQAAMTGKHILLADVPDDYLRVRSALGETKPKNVIVYPLKYEDEVKGVIELASTREFSNLDVELLGLVHGHIGIAINASQSRMVLKQLLEETQRQSEELEAQQEELRQFNEELIEKTNLLEKSEEELKAQHEELQISNEELAEKASLLEDQKQSLEFTKHQIEAKAKELALASQYKSEFLSNMSHELRTPLNSILILAQVLMENRNNTLSEKEMKFAHTIFNSGNDLLNLINEILDLSKIEAGKMELEIEPFPVNAIVQSMDSAFAELAHSKKINYTITCSKLLQQRVMTSDQQRIEQVLKNFLSNAFKFTPDGGRVTLVIDQVPPDTALRRKSLQQTKDIIRFTVYDTGIGIPEQKLNIIFEAFQQVDGSTKRQYGGTGLGLSISRELAILLGGEIQVTSQTGSGSAFSLFLPAEIQSASNTNIEASLTIHAVKPTTSDSLPIALDDLPVTDASHYDDQHLITESDRKILIMEDDVEFAKLLLEFVHERNYKGIIAHQGNIGLSYARYYKPDAIILDMKLPVIDGSEVLKKLKSDPDLRHIPVQIISGYDYRKSGLELGALDFIRKPVTREAFWTALDKVERFVSRKPKKLLIIEDDKDHNRAVQELIGNGDVKCYAAFSGKEGYEMLSKTSFDCVIVDLGLPDMSGFSFLEQIRENQNMNRIPIIVYTGKDLTREENARLEKLANTVVLKTAFSHERLLDETTLFLHRVESKLPKEKQNIIRRLHKSDDVLRGKRILIVDDDDRNVYSLLTALEPEGMECLKAANGKAAIDILKKDNHIDIILMDVMMPEMDGFEATRIIRSMPEFGKTPIMALTAKAMKDDREKCLAAGMSDYISKPLNVQQLLSLMRVWLYA